MPAPGLDPSWALALNQAVAQGLVFGKEIIFTLGPYSSIYTKAYHPATGQMMMLGSLYLAISYWICLIFLMKNIRWYWILAYCIPFWGMIYARDSLMFSYPLLVGLISYKITREEKHLFYSNKYLLLFSIFLFAPLGLLSLIKGSMLILCWTISFFCFVFFLTLHKKTLALSSLISPTVSIIFFWLAAGQSISHLPDYLISTVSIASSFTEAMSSDGNINELILYLITSVLICSLILWQKQISVRSKIFLMGIFFLFLFVSFKTGFTRHFGHAFIPGTSILLAALCLPFLFNSKISYLLILFSVNSWYFINGHYTKISLYNNFVTTYFSAWHGFKSRLQDPLYLNKNYIFTLNFLQTQTAFPILQGTTDIYSYNQSDLISSQNKWSPRPIFQSYSVFSNTLAESNKKYLQGINSPDNIIFKIEPIDGRLPSLEDGASWPLLLKNYELTNWHNSFLFLHKKKTQYQQTTTISLKQEQHRFGELVDLPDHNDMLFTQIEINPTFWGKLITLFFKPNQLQIIFNLNDGTTRQYRIIASMAKSDFLLSPLIENTNDFSLLFGKDDSLSKKKVRSFIITSETKGKHWNNKFIIHYKLYKEFAVKDQAPLH